MVKNPIPYEVNEVVDIPIPRYISPELSRKLEAEMIPTDTEYNPINDMINDLKEGKPIPYGPDLDVNKTLDVSTFGCSRKFSSELTVLLILLFRNITPQFIIRNWTKQ